MIETKRLSLEGDRCLVCGCHDSNHVILKRKDGRLGNFCRICKVFCIWEDMTDVERETYHIKDLRRD